MKSRAGRWLSANHAKMMTLVQFQKPTQQASQAQRSHSCSSGSDVGCGGRRQKQNCLGASRLVSLDYIVQGQEKTSQNLSSDLHMHDVGHMPPLTPNIKSQAGFFFKGMGEVTV